MVVDIYYFFVFYKFIFGVNLFGYFMGGKVVMVLVLNSDFNSFLWLLISVDMFFVKGKIFFE